MDASDRKGLSNLPVKAQGAAPPRKMNCLGFRRVAAAPAPLPLSLPLLLLLLLLLLIASGCERPQPPADTLVIAQIAEPRSLDPQVTTALNDFRILSNLFEGLVRYRPGTLDPAPGLAERWQISDDGRVYSFWLRAGVHFHDGTRFDAEAVRFNFERMLDPDHPYHDTGPFPLASFYSAIASIEVLDTLRIRFHLDEPFAPLLSNLAYPTGFIVSPASVKRWGRAVGQHPSGTGPFRFVDWRPGERVQLERFDGDPVRLHADALDSRYADPIDSRHAKVEPDSDRNKTAAEPVGSVSKHSTTTERPVQRLIFTPITDPMTRVAELLAGGVDLAMELSPDNIAAFRERPDFQVLEEIGPHLWFLILNTREGPLQDRRVRHAVRLAIDIPTITRDLLRGTAVPAVGPIPAVFAWATDPALKPVRQDLPAARRLLAEAGYGDGLALNFLVAQGGSGMLAPVEMAAAIQGDLARVGIRTKIHSYEWNAYLARVNAGLDRGRERADLAEMAWMTNNPETLPYLALRCDAVPQLGGFNSGYYCNPKVDRLIERARRTTDRDARAQLFRELAPLVHEDAPWAVIASWRQNLVMRAGIRGVRLEPSFLPRLDRASKP